MTDAEFARAFEAGRVSAEEFTHLAHLRVAWVCLREAAGFEEAMDRMRAAIRRFAASIGKAEKYQEGLTLFWMRAVADVQMRAGASRELVEVLAEYPHLTDKDLPKRFA